MYLCHTRPDFAYSVGMVSKFMQKSKLSHLATTKRILRYIRGTLGYEILFPTTNERRECMLVGYTDSSWCGDVDDIKFRAGYVFMLDGAPFSRSSRKEPIMSLSSCELKYIAKSLFAYQGVWLANLIDEIEDDDHGVVIDEILKVSNVYE